jgi:hypothetical protein
VLTAFSLGALIPKNDTFKEPLVMLRILRLMPILGIFLFATHSYGQQTSTLKLGDALPNKKYEDTHEITDSKLRAELGSLSKFSFKFDLLYKGAAVGTPDAKEQPNPDNIKTRQTATALTGSIGGRYRLDSASSVSLGTGLSALHPFHGTDRWDLKTPSVSYDKVDRIGEVQFRTSTGASVETVPDNQALGIVGGFYLIGSLVRELGTSGFATGIDTMLFTSVFNRDYQAADQRTPRYTFLVTPILKYNFSDKVSLSSSWAKPFWNPRYVDSGWTMLPQTLSQRVGIAYAFSKDIYFSPFVGLYPESFSWNTTTLNFQGIFSVL